jgi:hypothetical protein
MAFLMFCVLVSFLDKIFLRTNWFLWASRLLVAKLEDAAIKVLIFQHRTI